MALAERVNLGAGLAPASGLVHHQLRREWHFAGLELADDRCWRLAIGCAAGQRHTRTDARGAGTDHRIGAEDRDIALVLAEGAVEIERAHQPVAALLVIRPLRDQPARIGAGLVGDDLVDGGK